MNIILVGYGFYVLGNEDLVGGTIMPAILKWTSLSNQNNVSVTFLVRNNQSKSKAQERIIKFKNKNRSMEKIDIYLKSYDELENNLNFDCAILASPEKSHIESLRFLVKITNEIICVKPFTENKSQVFEALELSRKSNTNIFIDFHKRFDPANIEFIRNASSHKHNDGLFTFSYGQKVEMPLKYFQKWAESSNPFQYLAPHYLDIISEIIKNSGVSLKELQTSGSAHFLTFKENPNLISAISCNLKLSNEKYCYLVNAMCNWIEPKMSPYNSRQRIEFQTNSLHLISEQDNRGQLVIKDNSLQIPNPHFMTSDRNLYPSGYGIDSFCNFFDYLLDRFPKDYLVSINGYEYIAEVIDFVNLLVEK